MDGELCLHRHGAALFMKPLCTEIAIGTDMSAAERGKLAVKLIRHTLEGVERNSEELSDPNKLWQMGIITTTAVGFYV